MAPMMLSERLSRLRSKRLSRTRQVRGETASLMTATEEAADGLEARGPYGGKANPRDPKQRLWGVVDTNPVEKSQLKNK